MKRWLRWLLVCHAGHRCADVRPVDVQTPPGVGIVLRYTCEGCGTDYIWDGGRRRDRGRRRAPSIDIAHFGRIEPGESVEATAEVRFEQRQP